jgi:hypothetical protein
LPAPWTPLETTAAENRRQAWPDFGFCREFALFEAKIFASVWWMLSLVRVIGSWSTEKELNSDQAPE